MSNGATVQQLHPRPSMIDSYLPFVQEQLKKYPTLTSSRLHAMVRERGYPGGTEHFRRLIGRIRPAPTAEAYLRLKTLPAEQAQVDWGSFGKVTIGTATRALMAFVMVLSWSRDIFLRFFYGAAMPQFLRGHAEAFQHFGGVPRVILYDNLKSAVLERIGDAIRFNDVLLQLAAHYRFEPRPVAVARGNEKGRVERAIRYARDSFFAARQWRDLQDLNQQARDWCHGTARARLWPEDHSQTVASAIERESPSLLALPAVPFPCEERVVVKIGKTPYARFDRNDYSVPHTLTRRQLTVIADEEQVRIANGASVVAVHPRTWDAGQQIEEPAHIEGLIAAKAKARQHRGQQRLFTAAPSSQAYLQGLAERGGNLGSNVAQLLKLLDCTSADELECAIAEVVAHNRLHAGAVRQVLDRRRRERGEPPRLSSAIASDSKHAGRVVKSHNLSQYDRLSESSVSEFKTVLALSAR